MKKLLWTLAIGLVIATIGSAQAQEKGGQKLIRLNAIKTTQDIEALQLGDAVVMSCPKCKTVTVAYVESTKGRVKEEKLKQQHLCRGCGTKIETKGVGKGAEQAVIHTCKKCGSKDIMSCVLKKNSEATKGMEE